MGCCSETALGTFPTHSSPSRQPSLSIPAQHEGHIPFTFHQKVPTVARGDDTFLDEGATCWHHTGREKIKSGNPPQLLPHLGKTKTLPTATCAGPGKQRHCTRRTQPMTAKPLLLSLLTWAPRGGKTNPTPKIINYCFKNNQQKKHNNFFFFIKTSRLLRKPGLAGTAAHLLSADATREHRLGQQCTPEGFPSSPPPTRAESTFLSYSSLLWSFFVWFFF